MMNSRLFGYWNNLGEALRTGKPQNEMRQKSATPWDPSHTDEDLERYLETITRFSAPAFRALGERFDFTRYKTLSDVSGALALMTRTLAPMHPHMSFTSFDLPRVAALTRKHVEAAGLSSRISIAVGDFFKDPYPQADVVVISNVLNMYNVEQKQQLIRKAYDAVPEGGAFISIENVIDDRRRENAFAC